MTSRQPVIDPLARAFAGATDVYERGRPGYPVEAIEWAASWLGLDASSTVIDLAAGTGKLSRRLAGRVGRLIAVEPLAEMRAVLATTVPSAEIVVGTAESIPAADGTVDAVTVGEAFHWFDGDAALAEIHRVLRPGGGLALFWNWSGEEQEQPWATALGSVLDDARRPLVRPQNRPYTGIWRQAFERTQLFQPLEQYEVLWRARFSIERYLQMIASWSWVAALPNDERAALLDGIAAALAPHAGDGLDIGFRTEVDVTRRR
jgi:ubiquinone/menaquinone biosynthesis C-methylase UbiE